MLTPIKINGNGNDAHTIDLSEIDNLIGEAKYDLGKPPVNLDYILKIGMDGRDYNVGGLGMIGLITGEEKSRKTTFLKAVVAAALSGKTFINVKIDIEAKRLIYFDTEQPQQYFHRTQTQAHLLAGLENNHPAHTAIMMRKFSVEQRIAAIDRVIETTDDIGLIIIDGALDLVKNFNNETECQEAVQRIMTWTEKSGALILAVIHKSRGKYSKAIGHLGAFLERKCDFSIEMKYNEKDKFTSVKNKLSRTYPFPDFDFVQDKNGYPVLNHNETVILPELVMMDEMKKEDIPF